jgi:hypothetical protein
MTVDEDRALLAQLLQPSTQLSVTPDAAEHLIRHGRRLVRRRRWATVSGALALVVTVALIVGAAGLLRDNSAGHKPTLTPVSPHVVSPISGLVLGVDQQRKFVLEDLANPVGARILTIGAGATGQVRAGSIAANPGAGWVVAYAPARTPVQPATPTRLAIVDPSGATHQFGPPIPATTAVGGLAVSPDGSRIALVLQPVSGTDPPTIRMLPMPGHTGASRQWTIADRYDNEVISLSWAPDSRRLTYIAGINTGAGMAGNPSTLDTSLPGDIAPTSAVTGTKADCPVFAGTWLGVTGRYGAIAECPGRSGMPETHFIEIDPITARLIHLGPELPAYGCNENDIDSVADASRILLYHCGKLLLLAGGRIVQIHTSLLAFVWAGNTTGGPTPTSTPPVPATGSTTATPSSSAQAPLPPRVVRAALQAPSPLQYYQPTLQPGTVWSGRAFTSKVTAGTAVMALSCGCGSGRQDPDPFGNYPLISNDGGRTWRVDGPEFGRGSGGHGGSLVDQLLSLPDGGQLAWGRGSNFVHVTHDLGAHWYTAALELDYQTVTVFGRQLTLNVNDVQPGQTPYSYISNDGGLTWTLQK